MSRLSGTTTAEAPQGKLAAIMFTVIGGLRCRNGMKPERWQKVEEIYHAALEREEGQRAASLKEVCAGDEALRREVEPPLA